MATYEIRGRKLRSLSKRRYLVVAVRAEDYKDHEGWYVPFVHILKRTDNIVRATVLQHREKKVNHGPATEIVIFDTVTRTEV